MVLYIIYIYYILCVSVYRYCPALLDFSLAFDTIDHPILVHRLHTDFGFTQLLFFSFLLKGLCALRRNST